LKGCASAASGAASKAIASNPKRNRIVLFPLQVLTKKAPFGAFSACMNLISRRVSE
jgi:hypothetical protein